MLCLSVASGKRGASVRRPAPPVRGAVRGRERTDAGLHERADPRLRSSRRGSEAGGERAGVMLFHRCIFLPLCRPGGFSCPGGYLYPAAGPPQCFSPRTAQVRGQLREQNPSNHLPELSGFRLLSGGFVGSGRMAVHADGQRQRFPGGKLCLLYPKDLGERDA